MMAAHPQTAGAIVAPLRVLLLEDSAGDAELMVRELRNSGYDLQWTRVETKEAFRQQIPSEPDLIIADYTLPQFDALSALEIVRREGYSTPFIIVSGTITEEMAVSALTKGADDYLLKDRLARLGAAVRSALQRRRLRDERRLAQLTLAQSEERYRRLITRMSALVVELDPKGTTLFLNETVGAVTGYTAGELLGRNAFKLFFPDAELRQLDAAALTLSRGGDLRDYITKCRAKDGSLLVLEWNTANQYGIDGRLQKIIAFGMNVTEREQSAARILRLSRLYAAISETNSALVRSRSPDDLFTAVCRACVNNGGFKLAWVGLADHAVGRISVAEAFGPAIDYLNGIFLSTDADGPLGCGTTVTAYREQRVYICNDFATDPATGPWRSRAAQYGLASSVSLPLLCDGKIIGVLVAYGGETNVFDSEAVSLLEKMAENISFAMDQFEREDERKQLERERTADALRLAELSRRVVRVQEEERRRLARELHDRTSPSLAAVVLNLGIVAAEAAPKSAQSLESRLADTCALLEDTIAGIREISADLHPSILEHAGLFAALQDYAQQFARRTGIAVEVSGSAFDPRLAADKETALFRITQEAIANCVKHARADSIRITLMNEAGRALLTIADDGAGFDPDTLRRGDHAHGLGLLTMRERAEFAGGKFSLESAPGKGTRITVEI